MRSSSGGMSGIGGSEKINNQVYRVVQSSRPQVSFSSFDKESKLPSSRFDQRPMAYPFVRPGLGPMINQ